ncbi:sulfatase-like hydrolase/transferase [Planctomicrobium sp.]|jgi:arylsulfatase A-like enzyme|nr:sulfatase-like hydrolase/transferase [Planctomicrobium sp.]MDA7503560.1 sulfatase-like hydrolase/transferase [bacterium]MDB4743751.1 sulfatase-like hydrolase/transferase [Planctomicrobium sp.]
MTRSLLLILLIAGLFTRFVDAAENSKKRPNILFIYADDQSHRTVSCYPEAYDWVRTPNIDALAERGIRFTHAYVGTWCMPSRATMLTGLQQYGVQSMRMEGDYPGSTYDPALCKFWPSTFRKQGYSTAQIGKWHTGIDSGANRDWDFQAVWNRPKYIKNSGAYYYDQLIEFDGGEPQLVKGYATDNYTNWAEDFIRGEHRDEEKPWYMWVCYGAVHGPFTPAKRHHEGYTNAEISTPADIYPPRAGKPSYMQNIEMWVPSKNGNPEMKGGAFGGRTVEGAKGIHGNTLNDWVRQYHEGVLAIDESVGRLVESLKETGQYENTLIVYTADQGFAWGQHGFATKLAPYDANIRGPLIFSMPSRLPTNKVCKSPVSGVDIAPTFFRFADLQTPWNMHGYDLTPLLLEPESIRDEPAFLAMTGRNYGSDTDIIPTDPKVRDLGPGVPWYLLLTKGDYKYIRTLVEGEPEELYNLKTDPEELVNLAMNPKFESELSVFREATLAELKRTNAGMLKNLPGVSTD